MTTLITGIAIVVAGLLVGVELCVALVINRLGDALPADAGLTLRSSGARLLGALMPFWYAGTVVLTATTAVLLRDSAAGVLGGIAAALFAATIVLAVIVLVPINNRVKEWSQGEHPADWRRQVHRWDRWHLLRVALCLVGLLLLVAAGLTAP